MSTLPASGYIENAARTVGEQKTALEDVRDVIAELLGGSAESELTISSGSVTPTLGIHSVDTETDAASDNLTNIVTTNHPDGRLLLIHPEDDARTVVVKHAAGGAGQIHLKNDADFTMDDSEDWLLLVRDGTDWEEVLRGRSPKVRSVTLSDVGVAAMSGKGPWSVDTYESAASDDLVQITGLADGEQVTLRPANDARTVVVKNGIYIKLQGVDFSLDNQYDRIVLECIGSDTVVEISRAGNGS
jgi:hypothetical protein